MIRPISYDKMRSRHPIYPQENVVIVNSSSISNQNAKDTSGNFFADGFTPPFPQRQGGRTTNGIGGSNPGNGSGGSSSAPSSGNLDGNCPSNPTPKFPYHEGPNELGDKLADQIERKQFDPNLQQALAWKRLETGTHTQDDITWIKHECAERHHELKYGSGYNEAHNRAQTRFDGAPWENQF